MLALGFAAESGPLVVVLHYREDALDRVVLGAVGLVEYEHDVELLAQLNDLNHVVHGEIVSEYGYLRLVMLLVEPHDVLGKVVGGDGLVMELDELLATLVRNTSDDAHVAGWYHGSVHDGVLASVAVRAGELAGLREDHLVHEYELAPLAKGHIHGFDDLLGGLVVPGARLRPPRLHHLDGLEADAAVLVQLRQAPGLDVDLRELPVEELAPLREGAAGPFVEGSAAREVFTVLVREGLPGGERLRSVQ